MNTCLWLIIPLNALLGWFLTAFLFRFIFKSVLPKKQSLIKQSLIKKMEEEIGSDNLLARKLAEFDLTAEIGPLLEVKLDQIISQMAAQIPMGEFLIAGKIGQKLKSKVKDEILVFLPELKEHLVKKISDEFDLKEMLSNKIQSYDFNTLFRNLEKDIGSRLYQLQGLAALIAAFWGVLELGLIFWICR